MFKNSNMMFILIRMSSLITSKYLETAPYLLLFCHFYGPIHNFDFRKSNNRRQLFVNSDWMTRTEVSNHRNSLSLDVSPISIETGERRRSFLHTQNHGLSGRSGRMCWSPQPTPHNYAIKHVCHKRQNILVAIRTFKETS